MRKNRQRCDEKLLKTVDGLVETVDGLVETVDGLVETVDVQVRSCMVLVGLTIEGIHKRRQLEFLRL